MQLATTAHSDAEGADHASLTYRNGDVVLKGSFVEIWRKEDGTWRIHRSIFNSEDHSSGTATPTPTA